MPKRKTPVEPHFVRPPRKNAARRRKAAPVPKGVPLKPRAGDLLPVVFKEENGDGLTAKELQRRLAVRAAVSPGFIATVRRDFERHGAVAIARTRDLAPATYVCLAAVLLPMEAAEAAPAPEEAATAAALDMGAEAVARRIADLRDFLARERGAPTAPKGAAEDAEPAV
jgi:hypothetical protein